MYKISKADKISVQSLNKLVVKVDEIFKMNNNFNSLSLTETPVSNTIAPSKPVGNQFNQNYSDGYRNSNFRSCFLYI